MAGRSSMQDGRRIDIPRVPWDPRFKYGAAMNPEGVGWMLSPSSGEPHLRCECGLTMGMQHQIAADGTVSPSIFHPVGDAADCGFHVMGRFVGWEKREQPDA